jgi:hypothetical protein
MVLFMLATSEHGTGNYSSSQALERKRATAALHQAEEQRAMEEYAAMVEAQDRAHREALSGQVRCRGVGPAIAWTTSSVSALDYVQARLAAIASNAKAEEIAREEAEKQRTLR